MWTAGSVWIAPFEGSRWRSYGDSTESQKSRLGLVVSMAIPGRERWLRKSARNGGVESLEIGEKRSFCSRRHTWSGRAGAHRVFDIPAVRSRAVKDDLQLGCGEPFHDDHRASAVGTAPCCLTGVFASGTGTSATAGSWRHSASDAERWRLARKPKLRMRTKRRGRRCCKKRRRNSSASSVMTRC